MIKIEVKNKGIDKALKAFKYKFNRIGTVRELRDRMQFTKQSVKKRKQKQRAIYNEQFKTLD